MLLLLLRLSAAGLVLVVAWLAAQAVAEQSASRVERADHERFWGDGATADGSWAEGLRGRFGPAVEDLGSVEATEAAKREIHPRDALGRHRDPARVKVRDHHSRARPGERLRPEGVERPVRP